MAIMTPWEEAFSYLSEPIQLHSQRVSEYTEVLFVQASAMELYLDDAKTVSRLDIENRKTAALCGYYHDIGKSKALVAYQMKSDKYSPEEEILYRKHIEDGEILLDAINNAEKRFNKKEFDYILEAILDHHERFDGSGFPKGKKEQEISIFGRIVALCDELDHITNNWHSEDPFEEAFNSILGLENHDPQLIQALKECKAKLKKVFYKHISESQIVDSGPRYVKRNSNRLFDVRYRPITNIKRKVMGYEAYPVLNVNKDTTVPLASQEFLIQQAELYDDYLNYQIVSTCDTLKRFDACNIETEFMLIRLFYNQLRKKTFLSLTKRIQTEMEIDINRIWISIPHEYLLKKNKAVNDTIKRIADSGFTIILDDVDIDQFTIEEFNELNFNGVRWDFDKLKKPEPYVKISEELKKQNKFILVDNISKTKVNPLLNSLQTDYVTGIIYGDYLEEDVIVKEELASS